MKKLVLALTAIAAFTGSAVAADLPARTYSKAPVYVEPTPSWTGFYIFGGGAINDFAFTFLIGIITGTYSSIYIASALVLWWHKGERPAIGSTSQVTMQNTTTARV